MTIQSVIIGISKALFDRFGDQYKIHTNQILQNLDTPCFHIKCVNPEHSRDLGKRFKRSSIFAVQYFPKNEGNADELNNAAEGLFECLQDIIAEGHVLHGQNIHCETTDNVLTCLTTYDYFLLKESDDAEMGDVNYDVTIR